MKLNLKIRPEMPSDALAIAQVHTLAFGQDNEAKLVDRIRDSDRYIRELSPKVFLALLFLILNNDEWYHDSTLDYVLPSWLEYN